MTNQDGNNKPLSTSNTTVHLKIAHCLSMILLTKFQSELFHLVQEIIALIYYKTHSIFNSLLNSFPSLDHCLTIAAVKTARKNDFL